MTFLFITITVSSSIKKTQGKISATQGKHREFHVGKNVATLLVSGHVVRVTLWKGILTWNKGYVVYASRSQVTMYETARDTEEKRTS